MRIIVFGPPGSGKGTQAATLAGILNLKHINTGKVLRDYFKDHESFKGYTKAEHERGILCSDEIVNEIVTKSLTKENYVLDGYPRTLNQAKFLDSISKVDRVIVLDVPYHTIKSRILKRSKVEGRLDDNEETIKERFKIYREQTEPLLKYYKDKIVLIDGDRNQEEITKDILENLK